MLKVGDTIPCHDKQFLTQLCTILVLEGYEISCDMMPGKKLAVEIIGLPGETAMKQPEELR